MLRTIREIQPRWVVGENVRGLTNWNGGLVFDEVQSDLEAIGYEVTPFILPACAVNAPHRRDRVWFVAHSVNNRYNSRRGKVEEKNGIQELSRPSVGSRKFDGASLSSVTPDANGNGHELREPGEDRSAQGEGETIKNKREWFWSEHRGISKQGTIANTNGKRYEKFLPSTVSINQVGFDCETNTQQRREIISDPDSGGLERSTEIGWNSKYVERESVIGNATNPEPTGRERSIGVREPIRFEHGTWDNWPTVEPTIRGKHDGFSDNLVGITVSKHRNESIKAYGNAVVPAVVLQIFKAIQKYEEL